MGWRHNFRGPERGRERERERERGERGPLGVTILGDHSGATRGDTFGNGPGRKRPKVLSEITGKNPLKLLLLE